MLSIKLRFSISNLGTHVPMLCIFSRGNNSITINSYIRISSALRASYIRIYESIEFRSSSMTYFSVETVEFPVEQSRRETSEPHVGGQASLTGQKRPRHHLRLLKTGNPSLQHHHITVRMQTNHNTICSTDAGPTLNQLRRWPKIKPALNQCLVFAGSMSFTVD